MNNLARLMSMLHWDNDEALQQKGLSLARMENNLQPFMQPLDYGSKTVWDNCAKILAEKTDDELEPYLANLLEWLQDINWPGAFAIMKRLKVFSGEKLRDPYIKFVDNAIKLNNEEGFMWLDYLSELLDNENLKKELPIEVLNTLQKHYHNWTWWCEE